MLSAMASRAATALRPATTLRPATSARGIYIQVRADQDPDRAMSRVHGILSEDGVFKSLQLKRFHEKGTTKRKRKMEEQTIRHANRRIGSMIDYILKRKKHGF